MAEIVNFATLERIRFNVAACQDAGISGTYEADALDYLNMEVCILRDIRCLLAEIDRLTSKYSESAIE